MMTPPNLSLKACRLVLTLRGHRITLSGIDALKAEMMGWSSEERSDALLLMAAAVVSAASGDFWHSLTSFVQSEPSDARA